MTARTPRQIRFIIGNEACERFSFYGMRNILTQFLVGSLLLSSLAANEREGAAKEIFHVFVMGVYFFPLLGGWLSDRYLGKFKTIFWLSLVYCVGNGLLAAFPENRVGFYAGLAFISLGSGGIKPCVSAFVGEQFDETNKHLARPVFDAFYWIINFGSFFASALIPLTLERLGPRVAFGIPGVLMLLATVIFWAGRRGYVIEPPTAADPNSFSRVCATALMTKSGSARVGLGLFWLGVLGALTSVGLVFVVEPLSLVAGLCLGLVVFLFFAGVGVAVQLERARGVHPDEDVDGVRAVLRLLVLFALVTPFWSLFDQKASTWVLQARSMELPGWDWFKSPSQMQALNPALVMVLIPFNSFVTFPLLKAVGFVVTPLRKMTLGIALSGVAWVIVGGFQLSIDHGQKMTILWQMAPYAVLTLGEVLVSATGLEFSYSQAPLKMKGVLMSFWSLSVTIGSLWVLLVNASVKSETTTRWIASNAGVSVTAFQMYFFAGFAFVAATLFGLYALRYVVVDRYRKA